MDGPRDAVLQELQQRHAQATAAANASANSTNSTEFATAV
jgi:hypothetical protein